MRDEVEVARAPGDPAWLAHGLEHHDDDDQVAQLWHDAEQFFNASAWSTGPDEEVAMDACSDCTEAGLSGDEDVLPEDEALEADTTAEAYRQGKDLQGIPWEDLHPPRTRQEYRELRLHSYPNYQNLIHVCELHRDDIQRDALQPETGCTFFDFFRSYRCVQSSVVHFQLRHLLWATSGHDVYVQHNGTVMHWSLNTRSSNKVMDVNHNYRADDALGKVQLSTLCVKHGLVAAGGFNGEVVVKRLNDPDLLLSTRVTLSDNGITNGIEVYEAPSGPLRLATSNNDCKLRVFDVESQQSMRSWEFDFAINYSAINQPQGKLLCLVGDDPNAFVVDTDTGRSTHVLHGHYDYSFATAWHPNGQIVATGNQDKTVRVWDLRYHKTALAVLQGRMGAIRSLRFSSDGRFLAAAEPADFVHVYDVGAALNKAQVVDLFGEISGISFSPDADTLFVGVADLTYGSLLQFDRVHSQQRFSAYDHIA